jgi:hypothetical protein
MGAPVPDPREALMTVQLSGFERDVWPTIATSSGRCATRDKARDVEADRRDAAAHERDPVSWPETADW